VTTLRWGDTRAARHALRVAGDWEHATGFTGPTPGCPIGLSYAETDPDTGVSFVVETPALTNVRFPTTPA